MPYQRLRCRIVSLKDKLVQRIRPFVDAKNPGDVNDTETKAFEARIRVEAEDLKLESFGVEVSFISISPAQHLTIAFAHHFQRLHYKGGQLCQIKKVLWRWIPRQAQGERWNGQRRLGIARVCVSRALFQRTKPDL